jgi:hypothetical protein
MRVSTLTAQVTSEFGDVVPPTLIASTVASAAVVPTGEDSDVPDTIARADVAALAEAVRRASAKQPA